MGHTANDWCLCKRKKGDFGPREKRVHRDEGHMKETEIGGCRYNSRETEGYWGPPETRTAWASFFLELVEGTWLLVL